MKKIFYAFAALLMTSCSAPVKKDISVQLYSLRDEIGTTEKYAVNHESVFKELAAMGYTSVEAANYNDGLLYGVAPEQFKADVEAAGMKVLSSHTGRSLSAEEIESHDYSATLAWWDKCIATHKAAGMKYIVVPGIGAKTLAELDAQCGLLNLVGEKCLAEGILFGYHNHSHEFNKIEDEVMLDYMIRHTNPEYVFFEMDVYWTMMGHASPVDYFKAYPGRFKVLHIKDKVNIGASGMVGFDAIFSNADVAGAVDFVVEQEEFDSFGWKVGMKASIDYLLNLSEF